MSLERYNSKVPFKGALSPHFIGTYMVTSSAISTTNTTTISRNHQVKEYHHRPGETWEEIEAGRKREHARRNAEATRIRREQIVNGYKEELSELRERIVALRHEWEAKVVVMKWERAQAFERDEIVVVVEDGVGIGDDGPGHGGGSVVGLYWDREDSSNPNADGEIMAVDRDGRNYTPTGTTSLTANNVVDGQQQGQWQWSSRSSAPLAGSSHHHRSENNFRPRPPPLWRTQQQQQQHLLQWQRQQEYDDEREPGPGEITQAVSLSH